MKISRRVRTPLLVANVNQRGAEKMLGINPGNRCRKTALDCFKAREVGEGTGIVRDGVRGKDLLLFTKEIEPRYQIDGADAITSPWIVAQSPWSRLQVGTYGLFGGSIPTLSNRLRDLRWMREG